MSFGMRLSRVSGQGENQGGQQEYDINPANTNAIFRGDPVKLDAAGFIVAASSGDDIIGVFNGCRYVGPDGSYEYKGYWNGVAGSSDVKADVVQANGSRFNIELDSGQGAAAQDMIGTRRNFIANAGDPIYQDSRYTLGAASVSGTLFVVGLADLPGNVIGADNAIFEVEVSALQRNA